MNEIKVEPYIPDEDYDNPAMVVDFYEFTMANCLFLHGFKNTTLVFDMFFRKNPDNQGYSISAGQRKLTRFLLDYHFNEQDIHWLRTKGMSEEFCEYLRTYKWKGDMYALPEGTVCYPHVQMVRIECDLVGAILIETYLLQTMNFHSLIATKATRVTGLNTHTPRNVMEFGTRRTGRERRQRWRLRRSAGRLHRYGQLSGRDEVRRRGQGCGYRGTQLYRVFPHRVRCLQGLCRYLPGFGQPAAGYL